MFTKSFVFYLNLSGAMSFLGKESSAALLALSTALNLYYSAIGGSSITVTASYLTISFWLG